MEGQKQKHAFDSSKFENLVLFIVSKCPDPTKLGAVRLRKILYYSDSLNYLYSGHAITGATYVKWSGGPVPRELSRTLQALEQQGAIKVKPDVHPLGYPMTHYYAFKDSDLREFSAQEISLVDEVIQAICHKHTAESISRLSHHNAWKVAEIGEELPYESVFAWCFGEINEEAVAWAKREIEKYEARETKAATR